MDGLTRCAYRRFELAHVYLDTANELCGENNNKASAKFFRNKAYYERARANALLEMLAETSCNKSVESQPAANRHLADTSQTEDLLC